MNRKKAYLIITLVTALLYLIYLFRSLDVPFVGMDSYYFLNHVLYGTEMHVTGFVGHLLMSIMPQSIIGIKIIMFLVTLSTLFIAYECARLYSKKNALVYPISLISFITFSLIFFKFEDDLFALPFLFISLYFIIKYQLEKNKKYFFNKNIILSLAFLFISVMIWKYSVLFILLYLFITNFHYLYILASSVFIIFWHDFIGVILPNSQISENAPALLGLNISGAIIILLIFLYLKKSMIQKNKIGIYVFSILTLLNFKILYVLTPILLINNTKLLNNLSDKGKKGIYFIWFLFLISMVNQIVVNPPSNTDYEVINIAQSIEKDSFRDVKYSWGIGYFAIYHDIDVEYFGTPPKKEISYEKGYFVERNGLLELNSCEIIKKGKWFSLYDCP
jgi:hypothetical protein